MLFVFIKLSKKSGQAIISNCRLLFYRRVNFLYSLLLLLSLSLSLFINIKAQIEISDEDLTETVKFYKTLNYDNEVKIFQAKMPKPVTDEKIRKGIWENLPAAVLQLKINDSEIIEKFRKLAEPVLKFYGREKVYEIIVFKHKTPVMFSDTGVVLIVSTGMIERAAGDDELLGYIAHEIGHEYYANYSIYSRHLLKLIAENGQEPVLNRKYVEAMALIELQCDAFSAITLNYLKYNSINFIEGMEKSGRDFPDHRIGFHPTDAVRRKLIEQIMPKSNLSVKPKTSAELKELRKLIAKLENRSVRKF